MNFVIYAPDYTQRSAGVRALYKLCEEVNAIGETCFITGKPKSGMRIPHFQGLNVLDHPVVGIYPEIVSGNPFGADIVVRWLLNQPGKANSDTTASWGRNDLRAGWMPEYGGILLYVPVIDCSIFHNANNPFDDKRKGSMVYSSKAAAHGEPVPACGPNLAMVSVPVELLGWILRYIETLFVCEPSTIADEATLCGCEVRYVLSDYLPQEPVRRQEPTAAQTTAMVKNLIHTCKRKAILSFPYPSSNDTVWLGAVTL